MLKFSKHAKAASTGRLSPQHGDTKRQKSDHRNQPCENLDAFVRFQKAHDDFESFMEVVAHDLASKCSKLKLLKDSVDSSMSDRSYVGVQLFMLGQYTNRINRFRDVSRTSLNNISVKNKDGCDETQELINKHLNIIEKMKRRMKHIMDVSDKYDVQNMLDEINVVTEMSDEIETGTRHSKVKMGRCKSVNSLHKFREDSKSSSMKENIPRMGSLLQLNSTSKSNTVRSLTEHLTVLTKTYTNRR